MYYDVERANLAAIEYVIYKYGKCEWFNHQLRFHVYQLFINKNIFNPPLIIYYHNFEYVYEGYHYLIDMMERCDKYYRYAKWYDIFIFFYIVLILVLGVFSIKKYNSNLNQPTKFKLQPIPKKK